jgi:hypothetical protein
VISYNSGLEPEIEVSFLGKEIPESVIKLWNDKLESYSSLQGIKLRILQNENSENFDQMKYIMELKKRDSLELVQKTKEIALLQIEMSNLKGKKRIIPFEEVAQEIRINYPDVRKISYGDVISTDFNRIDTIPKFNLTWNFELTENEKLSFEDKLANWLAFKLKQKKVEVNIDSK